MRNIFSIINDKIHKRFEQIRGRTEKLDIEESKKELELKRLDDFEKGLKIEIITDIKREMKKREKLQLTEMEVRKQVKEQKLKGKKRIQFTIPKVQRTVKTKSQKDSWLKQHNEFLFSCSFEWYITYIIPVPGNEKGTPEIAMEEQKIEQIISTSIKESLLKNYDIQDIYNYSESQAIEKGHNIIMNIQHNFFAELDRIKTIGRIIDYEFSLFNAGLKYGYRWIYDYEDVNFSY